MNTETEVRLSGWRKFCKWLLTKVMGWKYVGTPPPERNAILIGVPHTSAWDLLVSYLYYQAIGGNAKVMIKKESFKGPMGWILRKVGGIPVDRSNSTAFLHSIIHQMNENGMHLAMCPEGTRKACHRWKTGYHTIAKQTGATVYLGYFDWKHKVITCGIPFELTDEARADTDRMQAYYAGLDIDGRHPEGWATK